MHHMWSHNGFKLTTFFIGNINIQPTYINNFDLRFEKYGDNGDFYAISGFYKSFKDPIELSFIRSATGQFTPLNLGDANVYGGEIEVRKHLEFIPGWENFGINFNFSMRLSFFIANSRLVASLLFFCISE